MKNKVKIQYQFTGVQTLSKTSVSFRIKVKIFMWLSRLYDLNLLLLLCSHILTLTLISGISSVLARRVDHLSAPWNVRETGPWACCSIAWNAFPPGTFIAPSRASSEAAFQWGISWPPWEQLQSLTTERHHHFPTLFQLLSFYPCAAKFIHLADWVSYLPQNKTPWKHRFSSVLISNANII